MIPVTATELMRRAGMEPHKHQIEAFESPYRQILLNWHRQGGKSSTAGALAWEQAHNVPGSLTLLLSRTQRQAGELFRKVKAFRKAAGLEMPLLRDTELSLETEAGSRIISLPANPDTVLGYSAPQLIVIDEAARCQDQLFYAIRPMMATNQGRVIALSTPWGKRGFFWEAWEGQQTADEQALDLATVQSLLADLGMTVSEEDLAHEPGEESFDWHRIELSAPHNPRLSKRFLANERRSVPDLIFRSEWLCEFTDPEGAVFNYADIEHMISDDPSPLWTPVQESEHWLSGDVERLFT